MYFGCAQKLYRTGSVLKWINSLVQIPIVLTPKFCLLGLVEELALRTLLCLLLLHGRKAIILCWKKSPPPLVHYWMKLVYSNVPLYQDTYLNRHCPNKFYKVWSCWLDNPSTATSLYHRVLIMLFWDMWVPKQVWMLLFIIYTCHAPYVFFLMSTNSCFL